MPKYKFHRDELINAQEMEEILSKTDKLWLKALISFCYIFGSRITEILRLKKTDFHTEEGRLVVQISILKTRQPGPFGEGVAHFLKANLNTPFIGNITAWLEQVKNPEDLVWHLGRTWETARVVAWKEMKELSPKISPHFFRHTRLTKLALKGATGPDLMDWAGWIDMRPAAKYLHIAGKLAEKFADKID